MKKPFLTSLTAAAYLTYRTALAHMAQAVNPTYPPTYIELCDHPAPAITEDTSSPLENTLLYQPLAIVNQERRIQIKRNRSAPSGTDPLRGYDLARGKRDSQSRIPRYDRRSPHMKHRSI